MPKELKKTKLALMMVTKQGVAKKVDAAAFHDVRRSGLIAISLHDNDELTSVQFVAPTDELILATAKGQSVRFKESDIREMGRGAAGVRGMKLGKGDYVVSTDIISKTMTNPAFFVISSNGYGKKTTLKEYKVQKRGGSGIKTMKVTSKTGDIISAKVLTDEIEEIAAISKKSQVIRVDTKEIPVLGRQTQGVRIMKLREGDNLASVTCL
jgi:DNA gyrase subunit A